MYEYIRGTLVEATPACAVVEAGGVGYLLNISLHTYTEIEKLDEVKLYTHYIVREDAQLLYGFATKAERDLFGLLLGVSGVGGNTARMILSTYSVAEVQNIIAAGNAVLLKNVKGLGLKTAQKIIVELSGRMLDLKASGSVGAAAPDAEAFDEALSALTMLGFTKSASEKVLRQLFREKPSMSVEDAVRESLKRL